MSSHSEDLTAFHTKLQADYLDKFRRPHFPKIVARLSALERVAKGAGCSVPLTRVVENAWGINRSLGHPTGGPQRFTDLLAPSEQAARFCFVDAFFASALPSSAQSVPAAGAPASPSPDEHHITTEFAIPARPETIGDFTSWEGILAIGAGAGSLEGVAQAVVRVP